MVRLLHVMQSPTTSIPTSLNVSHLVKSVPQLTSLSKDEYSSTTTSFEVLGTSLLRVGLAPSTPLYTKRNSLVATFGDSIISTLYLNKVLSRLWAFQRPLGYQKIMSSTPVSSLISSAGSLAVLSMDGTIDWIVANPTSLHTFCGDQLRTEAKNRPWIKRRSNAPDFAHTFLSGRGTVALSGNGQLFKVSLEQDESFLALKDNLVAYSVDSNNKNSQAAKYHKIPNTLQQQTDQLPPTNFLDRLKSAYKYINTLVHSESSKFVRIHGPTTLLLQSSLPSYTPNLLPNTNLNANPLESQVSKTAQQIIDDENTQKDKKIMAGMPGNPEDHLKVATIKNGKVELESTKDFSQFI